MSNESERISEDPSDFRVSEENEVDEKLATLRSDVYVDMYRDLKHRVETDSTPTTEELAMGAYIEALEPQVREAVLGMRRKGYETHSSGFFGESRQVIDGPFLVSEETVEKLRSNGFEVETRGKFGASIGFLPETADLEAMTEKWNEAVQLLPDLGRPSAPSGTAGAEEFRHLHETNRLEDDFIPTWLAEQGVHAGFHPALRVAAANEGET